MSTRINLNLKMQTLRGPEGITLGLDAKEIYPDDPGQGTPALVTIQSGDMATFNCASQQGEVEGHELTVNQKAWLDGLVDQVDAWLNQWSKGTK